jgi:hypothetical protein
MNTFTKIVCTEPAVRERFDTAAPGGRLWWRLVLALHGKPTAPNLSRAERETTLRAGLRFYAVLYGALAACLGASGLALGLVLGWGFPALGLLSAALVLVPIVGLGNRAARAPESFAVLFFAALIAFLALLLGAGTVAAGTQPGTSSLGILAASAATFFFGIGSYAIELVYFLPPSRN